MLSLNKPNVVLFAASRCLLNGTSDDDGDYIRVAVSASVSSLSAGGVQKNKLTFRVFSRPVGATEWVETGGTPIPDGINCADDYVLMIGEKPKEFNAYQGFEFRVDVSDLFATTQQLYTIPTNQRQFVLDKALGADAMVFQTATVCYYIANEGISVVENAGLMGLPVPEVVKRALEQMKEKKGEP